MPCKTKEHKIIESYITKLIIVDERFLEDLAQASLSDLDEFSAPALDTKVVTLPLQSHTQIEELARIVDVSAIRPGSIIVKPSYTDHFVPLDNFSEDLVLRKYSLFTQLCHVLGATKVSILDINDVSLEASDEDTAGLGLRASSPIGSADGQGKYEKSNLTDSARKSIMEIKTQARGGEPDIEAAEKLIARYGLHRDSLFTGLLDICRATNNRLRSQQFSLDFSSDVKRIFDSSIHAKIEVMGKFYGGGLDFERVKKALERNRTATKLSIVVEF